MSTAAFAKSHQPAGRASGPCRNFRPHDAPKISPTTGRSGQAAGLTPPRHPPSDGPRLTRPSEVGTARPRAPFDGHNIDKLRAGVAQGVQSVAFAQHRFAVTVRPGAREPPASPPVTGSPPSGMKRCPHGSLDFQHCLRPALGFTLACNADVRRILRKVAQTVHGTGIDQSVGQNACEAVSAFTAE